MASPFITSITAVIHFDALFYVNLSCATTKLSCFMTQLKAVYDQVIALNSSLAAEGELYVDDGKSYDFEHGAYIHRRFVFSNGKLTSSNLRPDNLAKKFSSGSVIERIILLGLPAGPKKAVIEPGNREADVEPGPLMLRSGASPVALVVRKPNLSISDDWTLRIL